MKEARFCFTEDEAKEAINDVLGEIYYHSPQAFRIVLCASVDELPKMEVHYEYIPLPSMERSTEKGERR